MVSNVQRRAIPLAALVVAASVVAPAVAAPAVASADDASVVVLGIRSIEGDDEFALHLTGALRHAASQVPGWDVSDREVSLAQMSLAHGCDEPDAGCMAQIAETLGASRVLYGTVRRTTTRNDFDYAINISLFNADTGMVEGHVSDTIPQIQSDIDDLRDPVERYIGQLSGVRLAGQLRVESNVPGAVVRVDGRPVGVTGPDGNLAVELESGPHQLLVEARGHEPFSGSVTISDGQEAVVQALLPEEGGEVVIPDPGTTEPSDGPSGRTIGGIAALTVAGVLTGATVFSWVRIETLNEDDDFVRYRNRVPDQFEDVCAEADAGNTWGLSVQTVENVRDVCGEASTFEVLQWVFLGGAVVSAGVGAYLILGGDDAEEPGAVALDPQFGPDGGRVTATVRF